MRRLKIVVALLFVAIFSFETISAKERDEVIVVAHRGDWRGAPENLLQAIENAIEMGVGMVEIDLKMTKDGHLILMHDTTLDRTTTGRGIPSDYTLEQIKELYLRNGANHPTHHRVPTFREAMQLCKDRVLVNVDKGYDYFETVYRVLEETNTVDQCVIKSTRPYERVREENGDVLDKVLFMPVIKITSNKARAVYEGYKNNYKPYAYEIVFEEFTENAQSIVKDMIDAGEVIWVNTLWDALCAGHHDDRAVELDEEDESWGWVLDKTNASIIQTDRIEELIEYLRELDLHD